MRLMPEFILVVKYLTIENFFKTDDKQLNYWLSVG